MQDAENRQLNFISANFSIFSRFSIMHKSNFNSLHLHMKITSIKTLKCWMSCQFFESIYCIRINFESSTNLTVLVVCVVLWFSFTSTSNTHTHAHKPAHIRRCLLLSRAQSNPAQHVSREIQTKTNDFHRNTQKLFFTTILSLNTVISIYM